MFGRDKWYKPSIIMDLGKMVELIKTDPACITTEVFLDLFAFLWEYIVRAMFIPGQIVQWNTIIFMSNLGATAIPRDLIINFGKFCQNHCLYHMRKAYYLQVGWGQMMLYKAIKWMIHPETLEKMTITSEMSPKDLVD